MLITSVKHLLSYPERQKGVPDIRCIKSFIITIENVINVYKTENKRLINKCLNQGAYTFKCLVNHMPVCKFCHLCSRHHDLTLIADVAKTVLLKSDL